MSPRSSAFQQAKEVLGTAVSWLAISSKLTHVSAEQLSIVVALTMRKVHASRARKY